MNISAEIKDDSSVDLTGKQGATWTFVITIKQSNGNPMNLTGYTARGQIRKTYSSTSYIKQFTCSLNSPATDGKVNVTLSATNTAAITCGKTPTDSASTYVYDIEIESSGGEVSRILEGRLFVDPEVTRA